MIEVARYSHFLLSGAFVLLIANYYQFRRLSDSPANLNYLRLCILGLIYCAATIAVTYGPYPPALSIALVLLAAILGFTTSIYFSITMEFFVGRSRWLLWLRGPMALVAILFTLSLIEIAITGESWTVIPSASGYSNAFFNLLLPGLAISPLAGAVMGVGSLAVTGTNALILFYLRKFNPNERFLAFALVVTLIVNLNDLLAGMNLNPYLFPLACFGYFLEIVRFQFDLLRSGQVANRNLRVTMDRLSKIHAANEIKALARHDLKHLIHGLGGAFPEEKGLERVLKTLQSFLEESRHGDSSGKSVQVADVVDLAFALVRSDAELRNVRLINRVFDRTCIDCDPSDLLLVFLNLFKNSLDAFSVSEPKSAEGFIEVTDEPGSDRVTVHVIDNAGGVPDVVREKLFLEPVSSASGGEGVGLLSVKDALLRNQALIVNLPKDGSAWFKLSFLKFDRL